MDGGTQTRGENRHIGQVAASMTAAHTAGDPRLVNSATIGAGTGPSAARGTSQSMCGEGLFGAEQNAGERDPAAFERALERLSGAVDAAARQEGSWLERVRAGLVAFLGFFDDEPGCSALLIGSALVPGVVVARRVRERVPGVLSGLLDDGAPQALGELTSAPELTGELVAGSVFAVIRMHVLEGEGTPLVELAPSLMAFIALPYLGQAAASAELAGMSAPAEASLPEVAAPQDTEPQATELRDEPLPVRATHRTMLVLRAIEAAPCSSNRQVMAAADLLDEGQASKLLDRLKRRGVIENLSHGAEWGEPNAWRLTADGERVLRLTGGVPRAGSPRRRGPSSAETPLKSFAGWQGPVSSSANREEEKE